MIDSRQLLTDYARTGSETAFKELVERYINLVYSTALRIVEGDAHRAQDVTQTVFTDLAAGASKLPEDTMLGGWFHRHTCFVASHVMRGERRRQNRERQAAEMIALNSQESPIEEVVPMLDETINALDEADRRILLLRFYEQLDLRGVGEALGISENAAQKRVGRALDQLHILLTRRGVTLSVTALGVLLAGRAVVAAPVGLAAVVAGASFKAGPAVIGVIAMSKMKLTVIGAVALACVVTPVVIQHQAYARLERTSQELKLQLDQRDQLAAENARLSNELDQAKSRIQKSESTSTELLRLRNEVGSLRAAQKGQRVVHQTPATQSNQTNSPVTILKEDWSFAGYATPDDALQSAMWALRETNLKQFFDSLMPDAAERYSAKWNGKELIANLPFQLDHVESYKIESRENMSDSEVGFVIEVPTVVEESKDDDGQISVSTSVTKIRFTTHKAGDEWKLDLDADW